METCICTIITLQDIVAARANEYFDSSVIQILQTHKKKHGMFKLHISHFILYVHAKGLCHELYIQYKCTHTHTHMLLVHNNLYSD